MDREDLIVGKGTYLGKEYVIQKLFYCTIFSEHLIYALMLFNLAVIMCCNNVSWL